MMHSKKWRAIFMNHSCLLFIYSLILIKNYVFYLINPLSYSPDHVEKESNAKMARFLIEIRK